jgi:RNA polymerase sigma factor (sigma-70 family)
MAHKRLVSAEDAREVLQNVFFSLWNKREKLDIQSLPLYLAGMTRFAVYRYLSNEKRRTNLLRNLQKSQGHRVADIFDLDNKQLLDILTRFTEELPDKYRIVFIHNKLLDKPLEEVARQLGVSPRTAEAYVAKVMRIMRNHRHRLVVPFLLF